jgi:hypothetical protein
MAPSLDVAIIRDTVLDAALALSTDPIPNIRFNVAKCLETLAVQCTNDAEGQDIIHRRIVPALKKLQEEDTDADVRYVLLFLCSSFLPSFLGGKLGPGDRLRKDLQESEEMLIHRYFAAKAFEKTTGDMSEPMGEPLFGSTASKTGS